MLEESVQGRRTKSGCWVEGVLFSVSDWQPVSCVGNFVESSCRGLSCSCSWRQDLDIQIPEVIAGWPRWVSQVENIRVQDKKGPRDKAGQERTLAAWKTGPQWSLRSSRGLQARVLISSLFCLSLTRDDCASSRNYP